MSTIPPWLVQCLPQLPPQSHSKPDLNSAQNISSLPSSRPLSTVPGNFFNPEIHAAQPLPANDLGLQEMSFNQVCSYASPQPASHHLPMNQSNGLDSETAWLTRSVTPQIPPTTEQITSPPQQYMQQQHQMSPQQYQTPPQVYQPLPQTQLSQLQMEQLQHLQIQQQHQQQLQIQKLQLQQRQLVQQRQQQLHQSPSPRPPHQPPPAVSQPFLTNFNNPGGFMANAYSRQAYARVAACDLATNNLTSSLDDSMLIARPTQNQSQSPSSGGVPSESVMPSSDATYASTTWQPCETDATRQSRGSVELPDRNGRPDMRVAPYPSRADRVPRIHIPRPVIVENTLHHQWGWPLHVSPGAETTSPTFSSGGSTPTSARKRIRAVPIRATKAQRQVLDLEFAKNQHPTEEVLRRLTTQFANDGNGASVQNLKAWFTDRRSKVNRAVRRSHSRSGSGVSILSGGGGFLDAARRARMEYLAMGGEKDGLELFPITSIGVGAWEVNSNGNMDMCVAVRSPTFEVFMIWETEGSIYRLSLRVDEARVTEITQNDINEVPQCRLHVVQDALELNSRCADATAWTAADDVSGGAIATGGLVTIGSAQDTVTEMRRRLALILRGKPQAPAVVETVGVELGQQASGSPLKTDVFDGIQQPVTSAPLDTPAQSWDVDDVLGAQDIEAPTSESTSESDATTKPTPNLVKAESPTPQTASDAEPPQTNDSPPKDASLSDEDIAILTQLLDDEVTPPGPSSAVIDNGAAADVTDADAEPCGHVDSSSGEESDWWLDDVEESPLQDEDNKAQLGLSDFEQWFQYSSDVY